MGRHGTPAQSPPASLRRRRAGHFCLLVERNAQRRLWKAGEEAWLVSSSPEDGFHHMHISKKSSVTSCNAQDLSAKLERSLWIGTWACWTLMSQAVHASPATTLLSSALSSSARLQQTVFAALSGGGLLRSIREQLPSEEPQQPASAGGSSATVVPIPNARHSLLRNLEARGSDGTWRPASDFVADLRWAAAAGACEQEPAEAGGERREARG